MKPGPPSTVSLRLPDEWVEIDPRQPDIVAELTARIPMAAENRELAAALLAPLAVRLGRLAATADVVLAGFYSDVVELDDGSPPLILTAQVLLAMSPPVGGADVLSELLGGDGVEVMPVDLPAGEAVLVSGTTEVDDPDWTGHSPRTCAGTSSRCRGCPGSRRCRSSPRTSTSRSSSTRSSTRSRRRWRSSSRRAAASPATQSARRSGT